MPRQLLAISVGSLLLLAAAWLAWDYCTTPAWLALLAFLPLVWWLSVASLSGLTRRKRWTAITIRTLVYLLLVGALAEFQYRRTSDRLTVIYLLDQSLSIPEDQRRAMIRYVNQDIKTHRHADRKDRAGVIVFGAEPAIEHPPFDDNISIAESIESRIETDHTNLAGALKLAQATLPADSAGRIVVVCDGNENLGDAREQARRLAEAGVGIDVVPVRYLPRGEIAVEKLSIPPDVNRGQPFDLKVVLNNTARPGDRNARPVKGKLRVVRKTKDREEVLQDAPVEIEPGKRVFSLREEIDSPDFYTYEARFTPDDKRQDALSQNNQATTFTNVRGKGQVLLIEHIDRDNNILGGEFALLVDRLRRQNLQVQVRSTEEPLLSLAELQPFDAVILANVPREAFTDNQISMLVRNTQQMGAGLIMLGGENSFGAGGWANTELEEAMPVDFHIKNAKVAPVGALCMLMHASEMAQGNYWQAEVGKAAIRALGNQDFCGVIHFGNTGNEWLWSNPAGFERIAGNRDKMLGRISKMVPGDMPDFDSAMLMASRSFAGLVQAASKHMIIISDGDPSPCTATVLNQFVRQKIKISTVAIGAHGPAGHAELQRIATATGGKYYLATNPKALPQIYQKEARSVARPLIYPSEPGFSPQLKYPHEMLKGIEGDFPRTHAFVMTSVKENPLVEVALVSPVPKTGEKYNTILASWTYGLGKSVVFTTDAGSRWARGWPEWENYDKFFSQMVRWSMRPAGDQGKFTVASEVKDGKVEVVITALDKEDDFLNFLQMGASVVGPDMKALDLKIRQTAPGRYVGDFDAKNSGSYFVMVSPGAGMQPILTGVNVPYSAEYLDRETNEGLLKDLAALRPTGSEPGLMIEDKDGRGIESFLAHDTYRHNLTKAVSSQDIWHLLLFLGGCLFFYDVFNRRVTIDLDWLRPRLVALRDRVLRREPAPAPNVVMERLRSRKQEVSEELDQRRAAVRFEPTQDAPSGPSAVNEMLAEGQSPSLKRPPLPSESPSQPAEDEDAYTSRLLRAKKKVWDDRRKDGPQT